MKFALASVLTIAAFFQGVIGQGLTINTPINVVECQPIMFTWSGGTPPYFLSLLPGAQPTAAALVSFGTLNGTSLTWNVNIAAGTSLGLTLKDTNGLVAQSAPFTVVAGTNTTCVGQAVSTSAGAAAPVTTTTAAATTPATTAAGTTTTPLTAAPATGTTTKPASSPASSAKGASTTTTPNAASPSRLSQMGVAGAVGAAVLALLA